MKLSDKQRAFWLAPYHRWNIKHGAARTGKTYLDLFVIPRRIRERAGRAGLVVLLGNTRGTLNRNVIGPLRELYGSRLISPLRADGTANLFGETVHCLGADIARRVDRLRGASVKYCYGDEVATWDQEVFEMLKSRLDKPYSCFDGTSNPREPDHWLKRFIDSDADIFAQQYGIDDNPFLAPCVREALRREHTGVFYERYVLGRWTVAEGLVFPAFAQAPARWLAEADALGGPFTKIVIGVDFGGSASATRMTAVGFEDGYRALAALAEDGLTHAGAIDANDVAARFVAFYQRVARTFGRVDYVFGDSAAPTMINTLVSAARAAGLPRTPIGPAVKGPLSQRPVTIDRLLNAGRLRIARDCPALIRALAALRWDPKHPDRPEDKNSGHINDAYDSFCYAWLAWQAYIDRAHSA